MDGEAHPREGSVVWRLGTVTLTVPVLAAAIGIDGGPLFQILATEDFRIGSTALGIAFGLGVVSVPVQLLAGRMPLRRARVNTQLFLLIAAVQCLILAALAGAGATGGVVLIALAITVVAEIALSVLYATSWQPLLAASVDAASRQRLNATWPAVARIVLVLSLLVFGAVGGRWRALILALIGVAAALAAAVLRAVPQPATTGATPAATTDAAETPGEGSPAGRRLVSVFLAAALINVGALPLWLVYVDRVMWPGGNLGLIAAVQILAAVAAMLAWRPTLGSVARRAFAAAVLAFAASCAIVAIPGPSPGIAGQAAILLVTAIASAGATTVRLALIEQTHRMVRPADVVRTFTVLDVVASTSLQVGLLAGGLLISAATAASSWPIAPYEAFVVAAGALAVVSTRALRTTERPGRGARV